MNRFVDYLRGLVADANLASTPLRRRVGPSGSPGLHQSLDHPTYLRRGLVISGLGTGCDLRESGGAGRLGAPRH